MKPKIPGLKAGIFLLILNSSLITANQTASDEQNNLSAQDAGIRIATFNIGLDAARGKGELYQLLVDGNYVPAQKSAEIIQRIRPDILLINEIDGHDDGKALELYRKAYLNQSWHDQPGISYSYFWQPQCNTGVNAGINFRGLNEATDNFGFGHYDGQYCMAVLSKYPINLSEIKTFQKFLWKDFPNALLPTEDGKPWYSEKGLEHFRLSSKTHADVPIDINGTRLNLLISHPTPPVFDGDEDRNGRRNHDEIKFWQHYIEGKTTWLYQDNSHKVRQSEINGLSDRQRFVILGDLNASVVDGDATEMNNLRAIESLLNSPKVMQGLSEKSDSVNIPASTGGKQNAPTNHYAQYHTASWKMRADYVIPSAFGFKLLEQGVFWPSEGDSLRYLVDKENDTESSSDHRLVWVDLLIAE